MGKAYRGDDGGLRRDLESGPVVWPARGREADAESRFGFATDSPVVACTAEEDMARQEYRLQSDLQYQVTRFGAGLPFRNGEVDFDLMDLTKAKEIYADSQERWLSLPAVVRDRYGSWSAVFAAADSGELQQVLKAAGVEGSVLPSAPAASPSDSAAGGASPPSTAS